MPVVIVCGPRLLREMLWTLFTGASLVVRQSCRQVGELGPLEPDTLVTLYGQGPAESVLADIQEIRRIAPWAPCILVAPERLLADARMRHAGVSATISQDSSSTALVGAVAVVQAGFVVLAEPGPSPASGRPIAVPDAWGRIDGGGPAHPRARPPADALSRQERRILARLLEGGSNKDIAIALGIAEATVKVHLRTCYEKIGVRNRTQAALWAAVRLDGPPAEASLLGSAH